MSRNLRLGDRSEDVLDLKQDLKLLRYDFINETDEFDRGTLRAVKMLQTKCCLLVDGIVGPQTCRAIALEFFDVKLNDSSGEGVGCVENKLINLIKVITSHDIGYGPGRGLFKDGKWIITKGPGGLGKSWKRIGSDKPGGPSFHCSSLVNFVISYIINRNDKYTHEGNIPPLFELIDNDNKIHNYIPNKKTPKDTADYRGFSPMFLRMASDGDTYSRWNVPWMKDNKRMDTKEILSRASELPLISVWSQCTKKSSGRWLYEHHVGLLIRFSNGALKDRVFRLAADGKMGPGGRWSGRKISWGELKENDNAVFQVFRMNTIFDFENNEEYPIVVEQ